MATSVQLFTGAEMPTIGLGTWQSPPGAVRDAVISAIEAGYRHVDCAAFYGNENEVGAGLEDVISRGIVRRSDIFVTSKLWSMSAHPVSPCGASGLPHLRYSYLHTGRGRGGPREDARRSAHSVR